MAIDPFAGIVGTPIKKSRPQGDPSDPFAGIVGTPTKSLTKPQEEKGEASKALSSFVDETQALGYGLAGLAGSSVKSLAPEFDAASDLEKWGQEGYRRNMAEAEENSARVGRIEDIDNFKDFKDWAVYTGTKGLANVGTILAGGGAGALAGRALVKKGVRDLAKTGARKKIQDEGEKKALGIVGSATKKGALTGAAATSVGMESSNIYGDILEETGEARPGTALAFGAASGLIDVLPIVGAARYLGVGDTMLAGVKKKLKEGGGWKKIAKLMGAGAATGIVAEGTTEAIQEVINLSALEWANENKDHFDAEGWSRIKNAAAAGALVGGGLGAAGGAARGSAATQISDKTQEELDAEATASEAENLRKLLVELEKERAGEETSRNPVIPSEIRLGRENQREIDRQIAQTQPDPATNALVPRDPGPLREPPQEIHNVQPEHQGVVPRDEISGIPPVTEPGTKPDLAGLDAEEISDIELRDNLLPTPDDVQIGEEIEIGDVPQARAEEVLKKTERAIRSGVKKAEELKKDETKAATTPETKKAQAVEWWSSIGKSQREAIAREELALGRRGVPEVFDELPPAVQGRLISVLERRPELKRIGKDYSVPGSQVLEMYAGPEAGTSDKSRLFDAFVKDQAGTPSQEIRAETGWFKGPDGHWRFEFSDREMQIKKLPIGGGTSLGELINHPKLFEAYPELASYDVVIDDQMDALGSFNPRTKTFTTRTEDIRSTMLHEIQHAIQDIEGFARGGSPFEAGAARWVEEENAKRQTAREQHAEAQNFDREMKRIDGILERGGLDSDTYNKLANQWNRLSNARETYVQNFDKATPEEYYKRLTGEVEARDTEAREGLPDSMRAVIPPYFSQRISEGEMINRFDRGVGFKAAAVDEEAPVTNLQVIESFKNVLPSGAVDRLIRSGIIKIGPIPGRPDTMGLWDGATLFVNPEKIEPGKDPLATILHEGNHAGLHAMVGDRVWGSLQKQFEKLLLKKDDLAGRANAAAKGNNVNRSEAVIQEERLAYYVSEAVFDGKSNGLMRQIIDRVKAWALTTEIGRALTSMGLRPKLTDGVAVAIATKALRFSMGMEQARADLTGKSVSERANPSTFVEQRDIANSQRQKNLTRWFGNSVVANADGSPKRVYHITDATGIKAFDPDALNKDGRKTTKLSASFFSESPEFTGGDVTYPVYLKMEKPFIIKDQVSRLKKEYQKRFGEPMPQILVEEEAAAGKWSAVDIYGKEFQTQLQLEGFDGIVETERGKTNYAVFGPKQIKSAVGNSGKFDPRSGKILEMSQANPSTILEQKAFIDEETEARNFEIWSGGIPLEDVVDGDLGASMATTIPFDVRKLSTSQDIIDQYSGKTKATEEELKELIQRINKYARLSAEEPQRVEEFKKFSSNLQALGRELRRQKAQKGSFVFETGKPVVARVHHGTATGLEGDEFDPSFLGSNTGAKSARLGFFSAGSSKTADAYTTPMGGFDELMEQAEEQAEENLSVSGDVIDNSTISDQYYDVQFDPKTMRAEVYVGGESIVYTIEKNEDGDFELEVDGFYIDTESTFEDAAADAGYNLENRYEEIRQDLVQEIFQELQDDMSSEVLPLYARFENPLVYDYEGVSYGDYKGKKPYSGVIQEAKDKGHDGAILLNTYDGGDKDNIFITFDPNQYKSQENSGLFSRMANNIYAQSAVSGTARDYVFSPYDSMELTRADRVRYAIQDMLAGLKGIAPTVYDEYDLERTAETAAIKDQHERFVIPMIDILNKKGFSIEDADDFVYSRHVILDGVNQKLKERNSKEFLLDLIKVVETQDKKAAGKIQAEYNAARKEKKKSDRQRRQKVLNILEREIHRSPELEQEWNRVKDKFSGITNEEASTKLKKFEDDSDMEYFGRLFDEMNRGILERRREAGVDSEADYRGMMHEYKHYATLRRAGFGDQGPGSGSLGKVGRNAKIRAGSDKPVIHAFSNTIEKAKSSIKATERNKAHKIFADTIGENPEFWDDWFIVQELDKVDYHDKDGFVTAGPTKQESDTDVRFFRGGKKYIIHPNGTNEKAMAIGSALNQLEAPRLKGVLGLANVYNKLLRFVNVSASPVFLMSNTFRDFFTAQFNLKASEAAEFTGKINGEYRNSMRALWKSARTSEKRREQGLPDADRLLIERFEKSGGRIGWTDMYRDMEAQSEELGKIQTRLKPGGSVSRKAHVVTKYIEDLNATMENVMRLSTFKVLTVARDEGGAGLSDKQAARIAKDLTTNFSRRGTQTSALNALYLFANAGIQGSTQILMNAKNSSRLRKMIGGTIIFSALVDQMNRALSEDEDEDGKKDYDEIEDYVKERNMVFYNPVGDDFITIPAPYGYNVIWKLGQALSESFSISNESLPDKAHADGFASLLGTAMGSFNPIQSGTLLQTLTPTILDPVAMIAENKDFAGNPLMPESFPGKAPTPDSELFWGDGGKTRGFAQLLNEATGGNKAQPGAVDVSPEHLSLLAETLTGSLGRTGLQSWDFLFGDSEVPKANQTPGYRQLFREKTDSVDIALYHDRVSKIAAATKAIREYSTGPGRNMEKVRELRIENRDLLKMDSAMRAAEREVKRLRRMRRLAEDREDEVRVDELNKMIHARQQKFNVLYRRRIKG